jgi:hypothetical protein
MGPGRPTSALLSTSRTGRVTGNHEIQPVARREGLPWLRQIGGREVFPRLLDHGYTTLPLLIRAAPVLAVLSLFRPSVALPVTFVVF